ncbi:MAG: hypothetical protein JNG84_09605, partial [Archangium sp.]|nr:hypothetical protein [Archangium sp.]
KGLISSQTEGDAKAVVVPGKVKIGNEDVVTFGTASLNDDAPAGSAKSGAASPVTLKAGDPLKAKEIALKEAPKVDIDGVEGQNNAEEAKEAEEKSLDSLDFKASVGGGLLSVPDFEERAKERQKRIDFAKAYEEKHRPAWMKRHLNPELLQGRFTELLQNQHYAIEQYLHVLGEIVPFINKRLEEAQAKRGAENSAKGLPMPAAIRVTQTELLATFLVEGGINCMDNMRMDHLDGYGDLGTDHFIDLARDNTKRGGKGGFTAAELALKVEQRYRDFLHPDLIAIIEDPDLSPPKWRWGSDERQKQYITVTEIDLRVGAYLSAAMFAGCKTAIAEAMQQPGMIRGPGGDLLDPTKFTKPFKAVYQGPQGTTVNGAAPAGGNVVGEFKQAVDLSSMSLPDQFFWSTVSFNCGQPYGDRSDAMWNARSNNWLETAKSCEEHDVRYDGRDFSAGETANSNGLRNALLREGIRQAQEQLLTSDGKSGNKPLFRTYVGKKLSLEEAIEKEPEYRKQYFEPFFEGKEKADITEPIAVLYVDRRLSDYQEYIAAIIAHPDCPDEAKAELEAIDAKIFVLSDLAPVLGGFCSEEIKLADGMLAQ